MICLWRQDFKASWLSGIENTSYLSLLPTTSGVIWRVLSPAAWVVAPDDSCVAVTRVATVLLSQLFPLLSSLCSQLPFYPSKFAQNERRITIVSIIRCVSNIYNIIIHVFKEGFIFHQYKLKVKFSWLVIFKPISTIQLASESPKLCNVLFPHYHKFKWR